MPDGKGTQLPAPAPHSGSPVSVFASDPANLEASWRRCVDRYRFDPSAKQRIVVLTSKELREHCEPVEQTLSAAEEELDYIGGPLSDVGFIASVSNMAGLILHYRTDPDSNVDIERAGSLWGEGIAGTNGVGTCIIERRPTDVQGTQHFFRDFAALSCTSAPILSPDSGMIGVLNFATANPDVDPSTFRLASGLVRRVAERLSNRLFRMAFRDGIILSGRLGTQGPVLFALDRDHFVVGANHAARNWLNWQDGALRPADLWSIFDRDPDTLSRVAACGGTISLRRAGRDNLFAIEAPSGIAPAPQRTAKPSTATSTVRTAVRPHATRTDAPPSVEECVGSTAAAQTQFRLLKRVYGRGLPVLILGETGTGKDTLARALHQEGGRADRPYVAFNCAAVPETLIDSELFGYSVGAFTGARREGSPGRLIEADRGTLFLDEIGDMPLVLQTRLLRVLESGEVSPLGSGKTRTIDVQIIAATNQNLKTRVAEGLFREDLYYRLAGVVIQLQPLRQREDFTQLARRMLDRVAGSEDVRLSDEALARLARHRWPGNARELKFVLQRAAQICEGGWIRPEDLMLDEQMPGDGMARTSAPAIADPAPQPATTARASIHAAERTAIADALARCAGDVMKTADALKISRATLYRKMRQHSLRPQRYVNYGDLH
ncbi:MAG: sigma-54-dependent Fis family transcriptional regulator [Xanthobacteraceae bacterium]|jgi:transcriptional regulator of acetoin/glycerol metabolism|nr:sigma-54-dependent Fis family transcriptional regulator [Xanthobacteraceae bacterium]